MKKILYLTLLFGSYFATAQEVEKNESNQNEVATTTTENVTPTTEPAKTENTEYVRKRKRLFYQGEMGWVMPVKGAAKEYYYLQNRLNPDEYFFTSRNIEETPILYNDFSVNYQLLKKLSLGAVIGIGHFNNPMAIGLKYGGIVRFNFIKENPGGLFLQLNSLLPIASFDGLKEPAELRFGVNVPIMIRKYYSMSLSMHTSFIEYEQTTGRYNNNTIEYRGIGFGCNVRF